MRRLLTNVIWKVFGALLASVLSGGITEELPMRLFFLSLAAWISERWWKTPAVDPRWWLRRRG